MFTGPTRAKRASVLRETRAETGGFPEIRKGPAPEVVLDLDICFADLTPVNAPSVAENQKPAEPPKTPTTPQIRNLIPMFTEAELAELHAAQAAILTWIANSDKNAELFFYDPLKAIEYAGITLNPVLRTKIEQQRSRTENARFENPPEMPRARIRSTQVHACPKHKKA